MFRETTHLFRAYAREKKSSSRNNSVAIIFDEYFVIPLQIAYFLL